jgi:hypothetical protein
MNRCKEFETLDSQLKAYCGSGTGSAFFKRNLAPGWWSGEMSGNRSLTLSLAYVVAQRLGVSLLPLINGGELAPDEMTGMAYKKRNTDDEGTVDRTSAFLYQLAKATLTGIEKPDDVPRTPEEMRSRILRDYREVDFRSLLDYCWNLGVPVLSMSGHIPRSGTHWHRPQAAVFKHAGKYCIFILEKSSFNAKPLFLLAHELGHIASGHLDGDGCCHLDDKVELGKGEELECEANTFALKLLSGCYDFEPCPKSYPKGIADWAIATGKRHNVNPGHLVLRDAFTKSLGRDQATRRRMIAVGMSALKLINQAKETEPQRQILVKEYENLKEDNYNDETYEYITSGTGLMLDETGE